MGNDNTPPVHYAPIDPELRDKIIATHTLVTRIDEEQKEYRHMMNGRIKNLANSHLAHKEIVDTRFNKQEEKIEKHDARLDKQEAFKTRITAYISIITFGVSVGLQYIMGIFTKGGG